MKRRKKKYVVGQWQKINCGCLALQFFIQLVYIKAKATLPVYDQSRIFDIRPKPKFSFKKIRPSAEGMSRSQRYEVL